MSDWELLDWLVAAGSVAAVLAVAITIYRRSTTPPPPAKERIEPTHAQPEPDPKPAPNPPGNEIDATNVKDTEVIGGSHGTQPRNSGPNKIRVTNAEGSRIVGGNDKP